MGILAEEQEVCINFLRNEDMAEIYVSDSTWMTKMDKLVEKSPSLFQVIKTDEISKTYKFPKKLVSIRSSIVTRELSDEQREMAAERLKAARENKRQS